jgi:hypothetical protein
MIVKHLEPRTQVREINGIKSGKKKLGKLQPGDKMSQRLPVPQLGPLHSVEPPWCGVHRSKFQSMDKFQLTGLILDQVFN